MSCATRGRSAGRSASRTQKFDFPTCSDENFWIFLRGATRRARLAPNRVKRRDRKIQLSSIASCSSLSSRRRRWTAVGRERTRSTRASADLGRRRAPLARGTPPPPGPAVDRTRPPCRTPPPSSPLLSSPLLSSPCDAAAGSALGESMAWGARRSRRSTTEERTRVEGGCGGARERVRRRGAGGARLSKSY